MTNLAIMEARMRNPVMVVPDTMKALYALGATLKNGGVPTRTLLLVQLRASQINGCSMCVQGNFIFLRAGTRRHSRTLKKR
jgi:alkylhydroperoxidase family enzyme